MDSVILEVKKERMAQNDKWGVQDHGPVEWMAILMEELGEVSKEAVDFHFKNPVKYTDKKGEGKIMPSDDDVQHSRLLAYRKELIQTAAVAIQAVECIDRNYFDKTNDEVISK